MRNRLSPLGFLIGLLLLLVLTGDTRAAQSPRPSGVTISPAFQQVVLKADETVHQVTFNITNNEDKAQTYDLSAADFNTLGESGGLFFVGTNPTELQKKYGLAKWFDLPQKTITIQAKQTITLKARIENLPDLSPGGHYGALMLSQNNGVVGGTQNKVSLHPIASSLMFVTKQGGDTHMLGLNGVNLSHSLFTLPSAVTLRFHNDGNTHVTPRGTVTLSTPQGRVISRGIINENSNIILPGTYRQLSVGLKKVSSAYASGRYVLNVSFRFDGINGLRQYQTSFFYFPLTALIILIVILTVILGLVYWRLRKHRK
jgi:hypothetical protein